MGRWIAWMKSLAACGPFAGANRLQDHGRLLRAPGDTDVTDVPFTEAKEIARGNSLIPAD